MKTLEAAAIIIARGGSKRIPRKNIRPFRGKPILAYPIENALQSGCFDEVMVSTDCPEIAEVAKSFGANVPFYRSAENSSDLATSAAVLREVLSDYEKLGQRFRHVCLLYPTSPFTTSDKITTAFASLMAHEDIDAVFSVTKFSFPIQRAFCIHEGRASLMWPEHEMTRSQDLEAAYHDAGQFYFLRTDAFLSHGRLLAEKNIPFIFDEAEVQDIDVEADWQIAEMKFDRIQKEKKS